MVQYDQPEYDCIRVRDRNFSYDQLSAKAFAEAATPRLNIGVRATSESTENYRKVPRAGYVSTVSELRFDKQIMGKCEGA